MKSSISFNLVLICAGLTLSQCSGSNSGKTSTGIVEYKIDYSESDIAGIPENVMPGFAILYFNEDQFCLEFKLAGGLMKTSFLWFPLENKFITLVKTLNTKLAIVQNDRISLNDHGSIKYTGNKKYIAGIECTEIAIDGTNGNRLIVYGTHQFNVKKPNFLPQYSSIDELLLEFTIELAGIPVPLKLTAVRVDKQKMDKNIFSIPEDFKIVDSNSFNM